jgi:hypothetical protein
MITHYNEEFIYGNVPQKIRKRTKENMEVYFLTLYDAFQEACREFAKEGTELWKAFYYDDFRKFIPSVYEHQYLDFNLYPLKYER